MAEATRTRTKTRRRENMKRRKKLLSMDKREFFKIQSPPCWASGASPSISTVALNVDTFTNVSNDCNELLQQPYLILISSKEFIFVIICFVSSISSTNLTYNTKNIILGDAKEEFEDGDSLLLNFTNGSTKKEPNEDE